MNQEKPGSTKIIMIKDEGTEVRAGEVVCQLDSANFRDELQAQLIKHAQAKAWVDQAKSIFEVNEITFREYRDGIFPQDVQLIKQYILSCEVEFERAVKTEAWSRETLGKGFRAAAQYQADLLDRDQAQRALNEARGMELRLAKFTAPRLLKSLEAKLQSIRADMLAQEAAFAIEDDRLRRIRLMIENCTIRAPRDGIVVYANQSNPWSGQVQVQIQEGATVREGQNLFDLPDPRHMRVKVKINESKMASIREGQKAEVRLEAFPGKVLTGTVSGITPIPAVMGRFSDIRIYFATVDLDTGGFEGLKPGLTAEVSFFIDSSAKATRVPVEAVRWVRDRAYVAVAARLRDGTRWDWRPVTLGLLNESYAEVVQGLEPGEKVVARPDLLPEPASEPTPPPVQTAETPAHAPPRG